MAMSSNMAFLLSPKPGAFTATHVIVFLKVFTTIVARASPSTSSAIIRSLASYLTICSRTGRILASSAEDNFLTKSLFLSVIKSVAELV